MAVSFVVRVQVGEVVEVLTLIESAFDDPTPLMRDVLLVMIRSAQLTFEAQGRPTRWHDLAESTIRGRFKKAMKGPGAKSLGSLGVLGSILILRDTGLLFQSIGGNAVGAFEGADGFGEADRLSATIGTNRPGADALQLGAPENNLPAREYLLFQPQDEDDIADMSIAWMMRQGPYAATL
jgi:phage gpG-like protein